MAHQFEDARFEIRSPYPGLRPFQDFESAMFYGRYSQTREVLERLRQSHFVALLGGSGSGKSSLIRAGVIPDLRSYQLREAGDFWVPVVFTPGTDFAEARSPLDRLACAFCRVLKPLGNEAEEEERRNKCVEILRGANGLAVLVDTFASDLNIPPGPDKALANFLFVVDQFEELFHPTNKGLPDCEILVDRLLNHFRERHGRVFVVLTMRSEHLNDCTGYLYLPDAINKASYLIRRLDLSEIEEAIEMPAKRFLRLLARSSERRDTLPRTIKFDEAVKERLKIDVDTLAGDPDHLPLLQHALFRLWEVACARANEEWPDAQGVVLPERITEEDLDSAIGAGRPAGQGDEGARNHAVLRPCLENWANKLFHSYDEKKDEKKLVEQVFRRLAFRDPNTSNYTQQRVELRQIAKLMGVPVDMLDRLVVRYMEPHEYLLRDMDGKAVKVAHESFIRGWTEFQCWVDQEYERFREYLNMLGECQRWERDNRSEKRLLGEERLRRIREVGLEQAFNNPEMMDRLSRLVDMRRDAERWRTGPDDIKKFYEASDTKQEQELSRKQAEARRRRKVRRWGTAFVMLAVLLGTAGLAVYLSMQQERRNLHSFAVASVTYKRFEDEFPSADEAKVPLHQALVSAKYLQPGDTAILTMRISTLFNEALAKLPGFSQRADLARIGELAEATIVWTLGKVLSNAAWKVEPPKANESAATEEAIQSCKWSDDREEKRSKLVVQRSEDSTNGEKLALYIQSDGETMPLQVYAAKVTRDGCQIGDLINSFPPGTRLGVDQSLRYFFTSFVGRTTGRYLQVLVIDWSKGVNKTVQARTRSIKVVYHTKPADEVLRDSLIDDLPSEAALGGRIVKLGEHWFRLFDQSARPLPKEKQQDANAWERLRKVQEEEGPCHSVQKRLSSTVRADGGKTVKSIKYFAHAAPSASESRETVCVVLREMGPQGDPNPNPRAWPIRGRPTGPSSPHAQTKNTTKFFSVYRVGKSDRRLPELPAIDFGENPLNEIYLGKGELEGWIAVDRKNGGRAASPWSIRAWHKLGCEVLRTNKPEGGPSYRHSQRGVETKPIDPVAELRHHLLDMDRRAGVSQEPSNAHARGGQDYELILEGAISDELRRIDSNPCP